MIGPPLAAQGWGEIGRIVQEGVRSRLYSAAVLVVGRRDTVLYSAGFGHLTFSPDTPAPEPGGTLFDLASLTKVVATASSALVLVDAGALDLDRPVSSYLPRFVGSGKEHVSVRMLLNHTSGLPAWFPLYRRAGSRAEAVDTLYQVPLKHAPGTVVEYSDLNALLLGLLIETVSGESLARFAREAVFGPLGMRHAFFMPDIPRDVSIAASRIEAGQPRAGIVNDKNAERFDGVAGHAGLFASGLDLARFAQVWLREGQTGDHAWVAPATMRRFLEHEPVAGSRALGWEVGRREAPIESVYGARATANTYGHTGWTGTFLWFDPTRDLFLVLLTNRSLTPTTARALRAMRTVRNRVSEAVANLVPARCVAVAVAAC